MRSSLVLSFLFHFDLDITGYESEDSSAEEMNVASPGRMFYLLFIILRGSLSNCLDQCILEDNCVNFRYFLGSYKLTQPIDIKIILVG